MFYKNGFTLHIEENEYAKLFYILDTATGRLYPWDISPSYWPSTEEFASRVTEIIEAIAE